MEFLTGAGLASAAGLNAYIPLLIVGLLNRYTDLINLPEAWQWLSEPAALIVIGALLAVELVADKVPAVDHVNDVLGTVIRPAAGGLVFGAASESETVNVENPSGFFADFPWAAVLTGVGIALIVHLAKMALRVLVNATTFGMGAPIVSTAEDGASAGLSFAAILVPLLVLFFFVGMIVLFIVLIRQRKKTPPARTG